VIVNRTEPKTDTKPVDRLAHNRQYVWLDQASICAVMGGRSEGIVADIDRIVASVDCEVLDGHLAVYQVRVVFGVEDGPVDV
jgi:hypothetical protein